MTKLLFGLKHSLLQKLQHSLQVVTQSLHLVMKTVTDSLMLGKLSTLDILILSEEQRTRAFLPTSTLIIKPKTRVVTD